MQEHASQAAMRTTRARTWRATFMVSDESLRASHSSAQDVADSARKGANYCMLRGISRQD
jgi:hypothetical protein